MHMFYFQEEMRVIRLKLLQKIYEKWALLSSANERHDNERRMAHGIRLTVELLSG